ncbi:MAG: hypothetical protein M1815_005683 [Lichina confinis]|nr:MAG: hypothetical protein M1815_005683 [Lichina confinis]
MFTCSTYPHWVPVTPVLNTASSRLEEGLRLLSCPTTRTPLQLRPLAPDIISGGQRRKDECPFDALAAWSRRILSGFDEHVPLPRFTDALTRFMRQHPQL